MIAAEVKQTEGHANGYTNIDTTVINSHMQCALKAM